MLSWQLLITINVVFYSISTLLQRVVLKENQSRPIAFAIFFQCMVGLFIGVAGLFTGQMQIPSSIMQMLPNLLLMTIMYAVFNILTFSALKYTEASLFTIILASRAFFTIAASTFFLKESLTMFQIVGTCFIIFGIIVANLHGAKQIKIGKGEIFAGLAALFLGLANTNDRIILQSIPLYPFLTMAFLLPAIITAAVFPREVPHIIMFFNKTIIIKTMSVALFYGLAATTFFAGLQATTNSSQFATISLTSTILIVILSMVLLKERDNLWKKIAGTGLSFLGLLLMR
ncbi:MAG: DMT family transporter [Candidatus Pacebacteria bacterium]|nr:DMT family transporter [Candidatus Paceibacterota bacterium]